MHYFRILLHVSSLRLYADITSIRHRVHHARADLRTCAGISQPDESIQSRAILKILDMFFERNRQRRLQTIHYYAILKIVDIEVLISQTQLALIYPALKKKMDSWIYAQRNSSLQSEIHIHYFRNQDFFDSTLLCVCLIFQETIQ